MVLLKSFMVVYMFGTFLFAIFQGIVVWWVNDHGDQVKKTKESVENVSNRVIVLETQKQQR